MIKNKHFKQYTQSNQINYINNSITVRYKTQVEI